MLQRLGHAGRLVIALQRRQLAERGAVQLGTSDASRSSLIASLLGRAEHSDTTAAAKAATGEAASAGATDASPGAASTKQSATTAAAEAATGEAASAGATRHAPDQPASGEPTSTTPAAESATAEAASAGATDASAEPSSGKHAGTTAAAQSAKAEAASAGATDASARSPSGKRAYSTAAAASATAEAASAGAMGPAGQPAAGDDAERRAAVNRLMYRSKQRGFLELDLLVGLWAERNVPAMSMPQLRAFEEVLDIENPDLFKWLTGQEPAPDALRDNASFMMLRTDVQQQIEEHRSTEAQTPSGAAWVRGWDDWKSGQLKG